MNAAAKLILKIFVEERAEIDLAVETRRAEGNPEQFNDSMFIFPILTVHISNVDFNWHFFQLH